MNALATHDVLLSAIRATVDVRPGMRLLEDVTLEVRSGEVIAIVGPSGSGKTTLLETLAGIRTPTAGHIEVAGPRARVGYVPQDDIVHRDLGLEATIRYAARLRLPAGSTEADVDAAVDRTLAVLGLADRRHLSVGALSGGQRKRASIATELVVRPSVCFLDEPTAGLDPAAAAALVDELRALADGGTAIVMTTHHLADVRVADRLIVMAEGGRVLFDGPPADGTDLVGSSVMLDRSPAKDRRREVAANAEQQVPGPRISRSRQTLVLARRNVDLARRNRMSLAIMTGSPLLVVAMMAVLFPAGGFASATDRGGSMVAIVYWLAFSGFFFGLTFGLLQVCTELPIVRRERRAGVDIGPYLVAKAAVLLPVLGSVLAVMLISLSWLGRLPSLGVRDAVTAWAVLALDAVAGLALGLLASSSVTSTAQAALALPMLCFPAVLFSGAVVLVESMTGAGAAIASVVSDRWAFEALARSLHLADRAGDGAARQAVEQHGSALIGPIGMHVVALLALAAGCALLARVVLARRTR